LQVVLAGWGTGNNGNSSNILQTTIVRVISNVQCEALVLKLQGFASLVPEKYICSLAEPYAFLADVSIAVLS
jgi:hypothetical protein